MDMLLPWRQKLLIRVDGIGVLNKIVWASYEITFLKMVSCAVGVVCASLGRCSTAGSPIALATNIVGIDPEVSLP
uniref:Uncharacterized protein n=1 Tax=Romanomermis culicivorax TaxID=13658 RepID=A0A915KFJ6_ROMCU